MARAAAIVKIMAVTAPLIRPRVMKLRSSSSGGVLGNSLGGIDRHNDDKTFKDERGLQMRLYRLLRTMKKKKKTKVVDSFKNPS